MSKIRLSYSSLNNLHNGHEWLNKQMGIPVPAYPFLEEGTRAHRVIQDHVSGKKPDRAFKHILYKFPIVEEKDFDERCKFTYLLEGTDYSIIGFYDGLDYDNKRFLEIKSADPLWSAGRFQKSIQRKIYALANPGLKEAILITCSKKMENWKNQLPKAYKVPLTEKDRAEALEWILEGIEILEKGDFIGGLDKDGKCTECFWNLPRYRNMASCNFK